jgi:hypothetical protein
MFRCIQVIDEPLGGAMRIENPVRCAKCYIRMERYELRVVQNKTTYHQHCFLMLVREKAARDKASAEWTSTNTAELRSA